MDKEIERGMGKALDPFKLADDLFWRHGSSKVNIDHLTLITPPTHH